MIVQQWHILGEEYVPLLARSCQLAVFKSTAAFCATAHCTIRSSADGLSCTPVLVSRYPGLEEHRMSTDGLEDIADLNAMAVCHRSGDDHLHLQREHVRGQQALVGQAGRRTQRSLSRNPSWWEHKGWTPLIPTRFKFGNDGRSLQTWTAEPQACIGSFSAANL